MSSVFFNKVAFFNKETLTQVFFFEFCEISKTTFLTEHLWTTASSGNQIAFRILLALFTSSECFITFNYVMKLLGIDFEQNF